MLAWGLQTEAVGSMGSLRLYIQCTLDHYQVDMSVGMLEQCSIGDAENMGVAVYEPELAFDTRDAPRNCA